MHVLKASKRPSHSPSVRTYCSLGSISCRHSQHRCCFRATGRVTVYRVGMHIIYASVYDRCVGVGPHAGRPCAQSLVVYFESSLRSSFSVSLLTETFSLNRYALCPFRQRTHQLAGFIQASKTFRDLCDHFIVHSPHDFVSGLFQLEHARQ